jgi:hypothetical protein
MCKTCSGITFILLAQSQNDGKTKNIKGLKIRRKYGFK